MAATIADIRPLRYEPGVAAGRIHFPTTNHRRARARKHSRRCHHRDM